MTGSYNFAPVGLSGTVLVPALTLVISIVGRRRAEEASRQASRAADAASRAKGDFLANMSHEIRTPMNDVLDYSKIESGTLALEPVAFDLPQMLDEMWSSLAPRAHQKGLELTRQASPAVPGRLMGGARRLREILVNVLRNAIKFTEAGTVGLDVTVEPRRHGGTGLGLAISSRLTALLGGRIWLESEPGRGSRFHVVVPLQERLDPPAGVVTPGLAEGPAQPSPVAGAAAPLRTPGPLRVLLAEDNVVNARLIRAILDKRGLVTHAVVNGREAVAAAARTPFDLALMDVQMPEMDGFDATRAIRRAEAGAVRLPIPALTANAITQWTATARRASPLERTAI